MTMLRRHALWVIAAVLACIAGAWLYQAARPHVYLSTAQVDVEANPVGGTPVTPNMATEQQVATSGVVLGRTADALGVTSNGLAGHLSASVTSTANVLSVGCTESTRVAAQRCANAAASAYIGFRNLLSESKTLQARDLLHATLVTPATQPAKPAGPGRGLLLPVGALLGLMLGVGGIVIRDHFDDRVRDRADLERCLEAPVLAAVPRVRRRTADPAFVFDRAPHSRAAEAYRYLRSRLKPVTAPAFGRGTVLLVAGPRGLEGCTCVAANLASALAQAGVSVILVDADLRHPVRSKGLGSHPALTELFQAGDRPGLSDLLAGTATLDEVALPADWPGLADNAGEQLVTTRSRGSGARLRFVAVGESADRTADVFERASLTRAFTEMKAAADVVVVDSAPVLVVSDAISLARASDLVVMVADVRRTGRGDVNVAAQELRATGLRIVVGVLNRDRSAAKLRAPSSPGRQLESLVPPPMPADMIATGRQNGQRPAPLDAISARPYYGLTDTGADTADPP